MRNCKLVLESNHRFWASHLPVADPAISSASGNPFLQTGCYISQLCVVIYDYWRTYVLWL